MGVSPGVGIWTDRQLYAFALSQRELGELSRSQHRASCVRFEFRRRVARKSLHGVESSGPCVRAGPLPGAENFRERSRNRGEDYFGTTVRGLDVGIESDARHGVDG